MAVEVTNAINREELPDPQVKLFAKIQRQNSMMQGCYVPVAHV